MPLLSAKEARLKVVSKASPGLRDPDHSHIQGSECGCHSVEESRSRKVSMDSESLTPEAVPTQRRATPARRQDSARSCWRKEEDMALELGLPGRSRGAAWLGQADLALAGALFLKQRRGGGLREGALAGGSGLTWKTLWLSKRRAGLPEAPAFCGLPSPK